MYSRPVPKVSLLSMDAGGCASRRKRWTLGALRRHSNLYLVGWSRAGNQTFATPTIIKVHKMFGLPSCVGVEPSPLGASMSFAFGFSGDDIEVSEDGPDGMQAAANAAVPAANDATVAVPNVSHDIDAWLSLLPSSIAYSTIELESPSGKTLRIARRDLFDVRQQLMAEDDENTLRDLETSDLRTNVYEGGFKTWECSIDLASLLLDQGLNNGVKVPGRVGSVIEVCGSDHENNVSSGLTRPKLGAGSALPSLVLFHHALQDSLPISFTVADFNSDVLRLVTLPNLLLAWARINDPAAMSTENPSNGELEVTPEVVTGFKASLARAGISLHCLSGPWSSELLGLIPPAASDVGTLVLAAETIYSTTSTVAFVDLVIQILKRTTMANAIVAAKRMYFGIGGSVDGLKAVCHEKGVAAREIETSGVKGMDEGIGRALVEIQLA